MSFTAVSSAPKQYSKQKSIICWMNKRLCYDQIALLIAKIVLNERMQLILFKIYLLVIRFDIYL